MFQYISSSPADTARIATLIGERVPAGTVFCLDGDLGAGNTLFVQNMAKAMGVESEVTSPTFNLMNIYEGTSRIFHFDLYRLEQEYELEDIGFFEYVNDPEAVVVIEWADRLFDAMPEDYVIIEIQRSDDDENKRLISFSQRGELYEAFFKEMEELCQY